MKLSVMRQSYISFRYPMKFLGNSYWKMDFALFGLNVSFPWGYPGSWKRRPVFEDLENKGLIKFQEGTANDFMGKWDEKKTSSSNTSTGLHEM